MTDPVAPVIEALPAEVAGVSVKRILIVAGAVIVLSAVSFGIYAWYARRNKVVEAVVDPTAESEK